MHGFNKFHLLDKLELVSPCHCTRYKRGISKLYPEKTKNCGVERIFELKNINLKHLYFYILSEYYTCGGKSIHW
ncbi:MAG: hypothetical protein DRN12_03475 [Thermoplasmata archaeon]|nr:MAG: hypothetical protein DRN12_03475 [Thermoplasmata archaeon]